MKQSIEQTVEEAAKEFALSDIGIGLLARSISFKAFKAGAEWQSKQSQWIKVGDIKHTTQKGKRYLLLLEDGSVVFHDSDWEDRCLLVIAYMPIPSFDEIPEANKDVLERIKEKGDKYGI